MHWIVDPGAAQSLTEQIAGSVRRAVADGELGPGELLPPARELAAVLGVNVNTVLAAYRRLRTEEVLEFRRGRSVRVVAGSEGRAAVHAAVERLIGLGWENGYNPEDLARLVRNA